jgi:hypothetical protein
MIVKLRKFKESIVPAFLIAITEPALAAFLIARFVT